MTTLVIAYALRFWTAAYPMLVREIPLTTKPAGVNLRQELRRIYAAHPDEPLKLIARSPAPRTIALTFDDGPHAGWTPMLLDELQELRVQATFFMVGKQVDKYPALVRRAVAAGNEVGNHTYHHFNLATLPEPQIAREYELCSEAIQRATGQRPRFCRPPGGRFDLETVEAASAQDMYTVLWTDDPGDFAKPNVKVLAARIDRQMKNGGILLLHDGIPQTMEILPGLVGELRKKGYRFITCSQLLGLQEARARASTAYSRHLAPRPSR